MSTLFGGLSRQQFLQQYWQKKPLLVRGAFADFNNPITAEELAGLACEDQTECRLVLEKGGSGPWEVRYGPFAEAEFSRLPESHWTLLVQEVDKHVPALAALLAQFSFVPNWRLDDIMVSYAADQGSVGPHVDEYDVFLIQGWGRRRWQISQQQVAAGDLLPDLDLRIMRQFNAESTWLLEPGDMLYLPPGVPHYGVAQGPCMTYSVGFRAPDQMNLWDSLLAYRQERDLTPLRYADPDLALQDNPGLISAQALAGIEQLLRSAPLPAPLLADWFGRYITESRSGMQAQPLDNPFGEDAVRQLLRTDTVYRCEASRFAYTEQAGQTVLYVDGEAHSLAPAAAALAPLLAGERSYEPRQLAPLLQSSDAVTLLTELINAGCLYCLDE